MRGLAAMDVSIHLALDSQIKAFVSFMRKSKNCHASISDL
jgi:hypothetical protein